MEVISYTQLFLFQTTGDKATQIQNEETREGSEGGEISCLTLVRGHEKRRRKTHYYWTDMKLESTENI